MVADSPDNARLNRLGNPDKDRARVLFTTQQMLESRVKRQGSFSDVSAFWFDGKPRQVRLWDEACLPARPLTIDVTHIDKLTASARKAPALLEQIERLASDIRNAENGGCVSVPDFEMETGVSVSSALGLYTGEGRSVTETVRDLYLLQGNTVQVLRDGRNREVIHYEDTLPDDLKPVVVCDASGRVRQTYPHWAKERGDLVELTKAGKSYSDMTLHVWKRPGGKNQWDDKTQATEMLQAIVEAVNQKPNEEFLIIHHMVKERDKFDLPEYVGKNAINSHRLRYTHWNSEDCKATNQYKDIPNIILAGTLFYPSSYYESVGKLSRAMAPEKRLERQHRREIELGEHAHLILQAVCRGAARKAIGHKCGKADVWVIASEKSGIPSILGTIFQEATILDWKPTAENEKPLKGRANDTANLIVNHFERSNGKGTLYARSVRDRLNIKKDDFNQSILRHNDFLPYLEQRGIRYNSGKAPTGGYFVGPGDWILPPLN